ncbi:MAG: phosphoglycerate dehydrogenase [Myxococcales bacterium]|nr:phosphoglycerate dehydrogenase [Myxococcales bacterium]
MNTPFRVLISDEMSSRAQEILSASDAVEVDVRAGISAGELEACIGDYDGLLVRSRTKVTVSVLENAGRLKVIGRAGIGVDNIDVTAASRQGVLVENAPTGNIVTTAEHAICLLLSLLRHIPKATASMKEDKWEKKKLQGTELFQKTFGVIGLGNIGRIVADRGQGLRMKVIGFDPFLSAEQAAEFGIEKVELSELLQRADFISIHAPLNDDTRGLIGDAEFAQMKDGAFLVNAARGGIVDEDAALRALEQGKLAGAAFDVFVEEPARHGHPLIMHPRVVSTPHLGASTAEAQINVAVIVAEQMVDYAETGEVRNALNANPLSGEKREKLSPWTGLSGKLGSLLGQLMEHAGHEAEAMGVEVIGDAAKEGAKECADHALVGLLSQKTSEEDASEEDASGEGASGAVNEVNARLVANEAGVEIGESTVESGRDLKSGVRLTARCGDAEYSAMGTLYHVAGGTTARIVEINEFLVELSPEGTVLVVRNQDRPGVIGAVGSLLGEKGINVNNLHVAHDRDKGVALALWSIASEPDAGALAEIGRLALVGQASLVRLGE